MKTAYIQLIRHMAIMGYTMAVYSEDEKIEGFTTNTKDIIKAVKDVEVALVVFSNLYTGTKASALVGAYGLQPDETIIDCSLNIESIVDNIASHCEAK